MRSTLKKLGLGIVGLVVLFGSVFAIVYARQNNQDDQRVLPPAPTVRVEPVRLVSHPFTDTFYGQIEPWRQVGLGFEMPGTVEWIRLPDGAEFPEGQRVVGGDKLIALDRSEILAERSAAEAELDRNLAVLGIVGSEAQAAKTHLPSLAGLLEQARADDPSIAEAQASADRAGDEFRRIETLYDPDPTKTRASQLEMTRARAEMQRAEAVLLNARRSFDQKVAQVNTAAARLSQLDARLAKMELAAPIPGFVTDVDAEVGETVGAGKPIVQIMSLDRVKAVVGVVDSRVARLREGQQVEVTVESLSRVRRWADLGVATDLSPAQLDAAALAELNRPWQGTILRVPKRDDPDSRLYEVEIELTNRFVAHDGKAVPLLRPGMIIRADVVIDRKQVFRVPQSATVLDRNGLAVYFLSPETPAGFAIDGLVDRRVELPLASARRVPINDAVLVDGYYMLASAPGATTRPDSPEPEVIIAGQHKLEDGTPVQVVRD